MWGQVTWKPSKMPNQRGSSLCYTQKEGFELRFPELHGNSFGAFMSALRVYIGPVVRNYILSTCPAPYILLLLRFWTELLTVFDQIYDGSPDFRLGMFLYIYI